jgi:hypothetical protein
MTQTLVTLAAASVVALVAGLAEADVREPDYRGYTIGTIRSIDRAESVVTMGDGLRLRATDPGLLEALAEGDLVKVDFARESDGWVIRTIEAGDADAEPTGTNGD